MTFRKGDVLPTFDCAKGGCNVHTGCWESTQMLELDSYEYLFDSLAHCTQAEGLFESLGDGVVAKIELVLSRDSYPYGVEAVKVLE